MLFGWCDTYLRRISYFSARLTYAHGRHTLHLTSLKFVSERGKTLAKTKQFGSVQSSGRFTCYVMLTPLKIE